MAKKKRVYTVDKVEAKLEGNVLVVYASGTTRTGGWTDPELVETRSTPAEKAFDFVATPPSGPSTDAITLISAKYNSGPLEPPFPRTVRVVAETNEQSAPIH